MTVTIKQLLEAGVHFGHQTRRWNPKMRPYIYEERHGIYIFDLSQTSTTTDTIIEPYPVVSGAQIALDLPDDESDE